MFLRLLSGIAEVGDDRGFTLLEGLVALGVFALVGTSVTLALAGITQAQERFEARQGAWAIAESQLDRLRSLPFSSDTADYRDAIDPVVIYGERRFAAPVTVNAIENASFQHVLVTVWYGGREVVRLESVKAP